MERFPQQPAQRGSQRWLQVAVNQNPQVLNRQIQDAMRRESPITWHSPKVADDLAEYRDAGFLRLLKLERLEGALKGFWPAGGPQWDGLATTGADDVLLVEAKAHIAEMLSNGTGAGAASLAKITASLDATAAALGATPERAPWTHVFYQLANRLAHLHFLRAQGIPAWLVLVNFVGDSDVKGPISKEAWEAAYEVAFYALGLRGKNHLSRWIVHVFPEVGALRSA